MSSIINEVKDLANYNLFSPLFIIVISFIIVSALLLIANTKLRSKIIQIIYICILSILFLSIIVFYRQVIFTALDTLVENIMKTLLFPSLLHIIVIMIASIALLLYVVKIYNKTRWLTITNIVVSGVVFILSIVSLILIANAENIYYIYKNRFALTLMEILSFTFYAHIIFFSIFRLKSAKKLKVASVTETEEEKQIDNTAEENTPAQEEANDKIEITEKQNENEPEEDLEVLDLGLEDEEDDEEIEILSL